MTFHPIWSGEVVLVISVPYACDQPHGESLLRDGFILVLFNKELGTPQVLIQIMSDTESAECPILLVVHRWHKYIIGWDTLALVATLGRNTSLINSITPALENMRYGALQLSTCNSDAQQADVMASKKAVFQVRYLSGQVEMGSNGALVKATKTNSRHHMGVIMRECLWSGQDF